MNTVKRAYSMTSRAQAAIKTERDIMRAMISLWMELPLTQITLEKVAERAGVTVRTVLRKFGSREELIEASINLDTDTFELGRHKTQPRSVSEALTLLVTEYEEMGDAVIRTIGLENELLAAKKILGKGRTVHRAWCVSVFEPYLPPADTADYELQLAAFIAATEIYLWKLLRRDLHKSVDETLQVFNRLINGLISQSHM